MRVSTMQVHNNGLSGMLKNQTGVSKTQEQISSGKRVTTPADDPVAATKILQLQQEIALFDQYKHNMTYADNRLYIEEAALKSVTTNLTDIRELTGSVQSAKTQTDRQAIAAEISERLKGLVDLFNTQDANGEYIFAGFKGDVQPFQMGSNGRYEYKGDEGQRYLSIANSVSVATGDSGKSLFVDVAAAKNTFTASTNPLNKGTLEVNPGFVADEEKYAEFYPDGLIITFNPESAVMPAGANFTVRRASDNRVVEGMDKMAYSEGLNLNVAGISLNVVGRGEPGDQILVKSSPKQSITDTVQRLLAGLNSLADNPEDMETLETLVSDSLLNLDFAQASVSDVHSKLGARLNIISNTRELGEDMKLVNRAALSELADVDYAEAVSRLAMQTFMLEAAQQSYTTISRMSLFNHM